MLGTQNISKTKKRGGYAELPVKDILQTCSTNFSVADCNQIMSQRLILFKVFFLLKDSLHFKDIKICEPLFCHVHAKPYPYHKTLLQMLAERKKRYRQQVAKKDLTFKVVRGHIMLYICRYFSSLHTEDVSRRASSKQPHTTHPKKKRRSKIQTNSREALDSLPIDQQGFAKSTKKIALFMDPNFECLVECLETCISEDNPPRFPPITSGEYLLSRYQETHSQAPAALLNV